MTDRAVLADGLRLPETTLDTLVARLGGELRGSGVPVGRLASPEDAGAGDLTPLLRGRMLGAASAAGARGAAILAAGDLAARLDELNSPGAATVWRHPHAVWAMAALLDTCLVVNTPAQMGDGAVIGDHVVLGPRVVIGRNVRIGHGSVVGSPGFGWATGPQGEVRPVPQLGGVVIEDDVQVGPLCTIDAGTLSPTRVRRGAKLDAHVHVGHNVDIGEGCLVAAQVGFAGSVTLGAGVLVGGQAGFADHVVVGAGARIAAKSGVIGDVPPGAVVAGYPAVSRARWLRSWAWLLARAGERSPPK